MSDDTFDVPDAGDSVGEHGLELTPVQWDQLEDSLIPMSPEDLGRLILSAGIIYLTKIGGVTSALMVDDQSGISGLISTNASTRNVLDGLRKLMNHE